MAIRIALIGMTGVGKSSVAKSVAQRLRVTHLDLDDEIERKLGQRISDFFVSHGEKKFREFEYRTLLELSQANQNNTCVLATGGGVITTDACRELLKNEWLTVWLNASVNTLLGHLSSAAVEERPLLRETGDLSTKLMELNTARRPLYEEVAKYTIAVDGKNVVTVCEDIYQLGGWRECSG